MLATIRDAMITKLEAITGLLQVDVYSGELEDLIPKPKQYPSAFVALASGNFGRPRTLPPQSSVLSMEWDVILFFQVRGKSDTATAAGYGFIEAICAKTASGGLTGIKTGGGMLWPVNMELLSTAGGVAAYRIGFGIEAEI